MGIPFDNVFSMVERIKKFAHIFDNILHIHLTERILSVLEFILCAKCYQIYGQTFLCVQPCKYIVKRNAHIWSFITYLTLRILSVLEYHSLVPKVLSCI